MRLALFISSGFHPSAFELHESVLAALADLRIHNPDPTEFSTCNADAFLVSPAAEATCSRKLSVSSKGRVAEIWRDVWTTHGCLSLDLAPTTLERVRSLETLGTVSDLEPKRKIVFLLCSHFFPQVGGVKYIYPLCKLLSAAIWKSLLSESPLDPRAGRRFKRDLLQAGGQRNPADVVRKLLGEDSLELHLSSTRGKVAGWVPNLQADVFQDIELLG